MLIYKITTPTGRIYIGRTTQTFSERMSNHRRNTHNRRLKFSIKKYGWENHITEIIYRAKSLEDLAKKEIFYIEKYLKSHGESNMLNNIVVESGVFSWSIKSRKRLSNSIKQLFENFSYKELHKKRSKEYWQKPEAKKFASERTKNFFENPENRKLQSNRIKNYFRKNIHHNLHKGKLTPHLPKLISMVEEGYTIVEIGRKFNCSVGLLHSIIKGKSYKGLIPEEKLKELQKLVKINNSIFLVKSKSGTCKLINYFQEIKDLIEAKYSIAEIARYFGVSNGLIHRIKNDHIYRV